MDFTGQENCKDSSNQKFIVINRFTNTCSLFTVYNIIHMMSLAFDTGIEAFSEVRRNFRSHSWWDYRNFFTNRRLQFVQWETDEELVARILVRSRTTGNGAALRECDKVYCADVLHVSRPIILDNERKIVEKVGGIVLVPVIFNVTKLYQVQRSARENNHSPSKFSAISSALQYKRELRNSKCYLASELNESDHADEMSPVSSIDSYPAFAHIELRENLGKNLNQVTCPDRNSNPGHLFRDQTRYLLLHSTFTQWEHVSQRPESAVCGSYPDNIKDVTLPPPLGMRRQGPCWRRWGRQLCGEIRGRGRVMGGRPPGGGSGIRVHYRRVIAAP
ncbi:hypothetical protein ANN_22990 [Periplaneta americana]|uniref:Uncharacterized protein n=1 Tax=Periplaneta americana TaxID=6978 RepID=A0ABQ8SJU5_PERAM|nr:hypothetical protein ANN_22990 [Periplaneta americana]